jgi:uncharacterized repeat protein (TIGR03803 family)
MRFTKIVASLLIGGLAASSHAAQLTTLHSFSGSAVESGQPNASGAGLIQAGSTLYGTAQNSVYAINADGSSFQVLHTFPSLPHSWNSAAGLTVSGSTLYGTTTLGGGSNAGTVFAINTNGTGYHTVYSFSNAVGKSPQGGLVSDGSKLYGTAAFGGGSNAGTVFAINADGTGFQTLHTFAGGPADGRFPVTGLTLHGSKLFGTTSSGGPDSGGTIFSLNTDGTGYNTLHTFSGSTSVGTGPNGDLIIQGTKLFGSTIGLSQPTGTATSDNGTLFSLNTDGTGFQVLHSFAAGSADGNGPVGSLVLHDSQLFGVTKIGGANDRGVLFTIDTDGSNFSLMHTFGAPGGILPAAGLTLVGDTLFGTTQNGGTNNWGTIYAIPVPEPGTFVLAAFGVLGIWVFRRRTQ